MKKCVTLVIVLCMVMSLFAFASDSLGLEAAVMKVKSITEIPEELTEFDYRLSKENGNSVWRLSWNDKEFEVGSLDAAVTETGDVLSFYRYDYVANRSGEMVSIDEAIETAELYAKTILGEDFSRMKLINKDTIPEDSHSDTFIVKFGRFENGIPVKGQECELGVNKYTSVFETYSGFIFDREISYPSPENVISRDKAILAFAEQLGVELQYRTNHNHKTDEFNIYPAYFLNDDEYAIDAFTGEKTELPDLNEVYKNGITFDSSESMGSANLSPQEQAAVNELGNLLNENDAAEILKKKVKAFDGISLKSSYLGKNGKDRYVLNLEYSDEKDFYGSAAMDAQTGEILNFYLSDSGAEDTKKQLTDEEIINKASDLATLLAGEKFDNVKPQYKDGNVYFARYENGIKVVGDGIRIGYNKKTDVIYSYSINWTDINAFPDVTGIMDGQTAVNSIIDFLGYDLYYMGEKLLYDFAEKSHSVFSPYNGNPLNYDGSEYAIEKLGGYDDIEGHWCEETVNKLLENNLGFEGESFLPENAVTQRDFIKLVYKTYQFETDEEIEEYIKNRKLFKNINLDQNVSRNEAARAFAVMMGHLELAEKSEIFIKPFNDSADDEFTGFTAACKAFGIISGDGNGNYRGNDTVTRAEIATMLYRFICR